MDPVEHASKEDIKSNATGSNTPSESGTVQSIRYLDDVVLITDDNFQVPSQQEVDLNNKNRE